VNVDVPYSAQLPLLEGYPVSRGQPSAPSGDWSSLLPIMQMSRNHGDGTSPLAHHPVTSLYVSGPVRFPLDLRLYLRDEELTQWEA